MNKIPILIRGSTVGQLNKPWEQILNLAEIREFQKGNVLDIEDINNNNKFYYIVSGKVKISYIKVSGEERTVIYAYPGTLMNVPTVLADDSANTIAECLEKSRIAFFDARLLRDPAFVATHPELIINLLHSLSLQLVIQARRLDADGSGSALQLVAGFFLELAERNNARRVFAPGITQQELSVLLGIHRTTITRALVLLRRDGIIGKFTKTELHILDIERLKKIACGI